LWTQGSLLKKKSLGKGRLLMYAKAFITLNALRYLCNIAIFTMCCCSIQFMKGNNISSTRMAVAIKKLEKRQHDSIRRHHEHCDQLRTDYLDTIAFKAYKAYLETRREVAVLATINHAHVIRFFGVQLSPRSLILEWAPMGSLDNVLEKYEDNSIAPRPFQQLMIQVSNSLFDVSFDFQYACC
jgi:hypothetical protein